MNSTISEIKENMKLPELRKSKIRGKTPFYYRKVHFASKSKCMCLTIPEEYSNALGMVTDNNANAMYLKLTLEGSKIILEKV